MSGLVRDFTDDSKQKILSYVKNATANGWWEGLKDFFGDAWSIGRSWCGKLEVENYVDNIEAYQQEVVDMYDTTAEKVEQIFQAVAAVDQQFSNGDPGYLSKALEELTAIKTYIEALTGVVDPSKITQKEIDALNNAATALSAKQTEMEQQVQKEMQGTKKIEAEMSEDPVNLSSGNLSYEHQDLFINGAVPLAFHRFYNSTDKDINVLGQGFVHNYQISVKTKDDKKFEICFADGQRKHFEKKADGVIVGHRAAIESLKETETGYRLDTLEGLSYIFGKDGVLRRLENRNNLGITFEYENGMLIRALSDSNTFLKYVYSQGKLIEVEDNSGRKVKLSYDGDKLIKAECPGNKTYLYEYADNGNIIEVTNPRNIVGLENKYDNKNRVVYQRFPDGSEESFDYDDENNTVTYTKRNGTKVVHVHDDKLRNIENKYEDGTSEKFIYNDKNQLIKKVYRNGAVERFAYDNRGNLTQYIDKSKCKTNYTYDSNNCLLTVSVNGITRIKREYDNKGNLISLLNTVGNEIRVKNDDTGKPIEIIYPDGSKDTFKYDDFGNTIEIVERGAGRTILGYDELNRVVSATDAVGNTTKYTYDEYDNLIEVTNALGEKRQYFYDKGGHTVEVNDFDGNSSYQEFNELGKVTKLVDKEGNAITFEYDKMWNVSESHFPNGGQIKYKYNSDNLLNKVILPNGGIITNEYDSVGNKIATIDSLGRETSYKYDDSNNIVRIDLPDDLCETREYDREGNLVKEIDSLGNETKYTYDEYGRLKESIDKVGNKYSFEYDCEGNLSTIIYPNNSITRYEYANGKQLQNVILNNGSSEHYQYDEKGRLIRRTNAMNESLSVEYDQLDRIVKIINPIGGERRFSYDSLGNVISIVDELGNKTEYEYSKNGNLIQVLDAMGNKTEYTYDCLGKLVKTIQHGANGEEKVNSYAYDQMGNIIEAINPLGEVEKYTYNLANEIVSRLDRDGFETKFRYTDTGRVKSVEYEDGRSVNVKYDSLNHLREIEDWTGITQVQSDVLGRATQVINPDGQMIKYDYNELGQKSSITYPDGEVAKYNYDEKGLMTSLQFGGKSIAYQYDSMARLTKKIMPDVVTDYVYNSIGHIERLCHIGNNLEEVLEYAYDKSGNKTSTTSIRNGLKEVFDYKYDELNRLTEVSNSKGTIRLYEYDSFGNRIVKDDIENGKTIRYQYNNADQLISEEVEGKVTNYEYDARGNLITVKSGNEILKEIIFDATNQMAEIKTSDGVARYKYNGYGHRVSKTINDVQINYTVDLTREYSNLLGMSSNKAGNIYNKKFFWDSNVAAMEYDDELSFFLQDDLGSPIDLLGKDGDVMEQYHYDEFGKSKSNSNYQPFTYTGYEIDESGLYFAQARRYNPDQGRFISEDILKGETISPYTLNHYNYCWNSPLILVDKNGLEPMDAEEFIDKGLESISQSADDKIHQGGLGYLNDVDDAATSETVVKYVNKNYKIPTFTQEGEYIRITNSEYATAPSGIKRIKETKLDSWSSNPEGWQKDLGKAYDADNIMKNTAKAKNIAEKAGTVMTVALAAKDFEDEVQASAAAPKTKQFTNATVETGVNLAVGAASAKIGMELGGFVGSVLPIPIVGTVVGMVLGAALGFVIGIAIDGILNAKWFCGGTKSAMDLLKDGAFYVFSSGAQYFGFCPAEG